ncbi:hypothetical protein CYLTODRAFT_418526 [Cylindrobasidium torrendii FP15055 ss-10]|uniref:Uncharacterized protein n=1 Tax=Cylindrobasidium torrendii FP15055 ss-10 TaxID=1314674 RepID=A0A0D7BMY5_9AGAR|nr:hypothetical protein CYLTODRAFT_418526 [Cylindrobasidium torrendii FP15055 ss-10]
MDSSPPQEEQDVAARLCLLSTGVSLLGLTAAEISHEFESMKDAAGVVSSEDMDMFYASARLLPDIDKTLPSLLRAELVWHSLPRKQGTMIDGKVGTIDLRTWDLVPIRADYECTFCVDRGYLCEYECRTSPGKKKCRECRLQNHVCDMQGRRDQRRSVQPTTTRSTPSSIISGGTKRKLANTEASTSGKPVKMPKAATETPSTTASSQIKTVQSSIMKTPASAAGPAHVDLSFLENESLRDIYTSKWKNHARRAKLHESRVKQSQLEHEKKHELIQKLQKEREDKTHALNNLRMKVVRSVNISRDLRV